MDPIYEVHKQEILLAIGLFQIFEHRLLAWIPSRGKYYSVIIKILLATLLMEHTGTLPAASTAATTLFISCPS